jgi:hypothetical protein
LTTTTILGLHKPATCERNWDVDLNANADLLEAAIAPITQAGAVHDSAARNGSLFLGLDHLDGATVPAPKLCRKDGAGNVTVLG